MQKTNTRQSNIELLRIIAAMGVIFLHYNNQAIGGGFSFVEKGSVNQMVMLFFEVISICAVNLFVLISGYFLRSSGKRSLLKPIELIAELIILGLVFYVIYEIPKGEGFSLDTFLSYFTPSYWFVFVYAALYLISPYINIVWDHLKEDGRKMLLALTFVLFSLYPMLIDLLKYWTGRTFNGASTIGIEGSQGGYTIVNFVLMYLIGCYLRDYSGEAQGRVDERSTWAGAVKKGNTGANKGSSGAGAMTGRKFRFIGTPRLLLFLLIDVLVLFLWTVIEARITGKEIFMTAFWNYENPLVIIEAVLMFLIFRNMKIRESKIINSLAKASFSVYLIHIQLLKYCSIDTFANSSVIVLILHMILSAILIYGASYVIFCIYSLITKPLLGLIDEKWKKGKTYSV